MNGFVIAEDVSHVLEAGRTPIRAPWDRCPAHDLATPGRLTTGLVHKAALAVEHALLGPALLGPYSDRERALLHALLLSAGCPHGLELPLPLLFRQPAGAYGAGPACSGGPPPLPEPPVRRRLELLYDAGAVIGTTPDATCTAEELTQVCVPRFADEVTLSLGGAPEAPVLDDRLILVPLRARGTPLGTVSFQRAEPTGPFEKDDLALAQELAARAALAIDSARLSAREQHLALELQRSLLPQVLPEQHAVEAAYRYLPARGRAEGGADGLADSRTGVAGDWFDVIPLSGARVALVVGDVAGRGLHAAAAMGRLRTAVHNFSALDLAPDELLGRLDDLTDRTPGLTGATCLYAVYDPVSRLCSMARAGHPPPALVRPDGRVEFPEPPAGPPLGAGGPPYDSLELELPEGSDLVLYTDGLIGGRDLDPDTGIRLLRHALAARPAAATPEQVCAAVQETLLPSSAVTDDVALLVARTRTLDSSRVATWDVPDDPAAVSDLRAAIIRRLTDWGLADLAFTTELIASELITNAIRHADGPVHARLLRDRALVFEVSDGSGTSPRLRRAATTDEGGRGIFLVARLSARWGTRHTARGKVIWTEQETGRHG